MPLRSELSQATFFAGLDALLRIFSCNLKLAHLEVTLQGTWQVARCLTGFTTLSINERVIILGVGGEGGWVGEVGLGRWGWGGKLLYDTQSHCRRMTV